MAEAKVDAPRFLLYKDEGGIKPHLALCCLLLSEYEKGKELKKRNCLFTSLVRILSLGYLHNQVSASFKCCVQLLDFCICKV